MRQLLILVHIDDLASEPPMTDAGDNMSIIIDEEEEDAVPVSHSYLV
jgi:hypothetical protein